MATITVPFATKADLVARWRTLTPSEEATATTLLDDASSQVLDECSSANVVPDDDAAALAQRTATLKRIVCAMVKRAMIDGDADSPSVAEEQVSAGPFGFRQKFANPTGDLYLTKAERRQLPCGKQSAFTVPMYVVDEDDLS